MKPGPNRYDVDKLVADCKEALAIDMTPEVAWKATKAKNADLCPDKVLELFKDHVLARASPAAPVDLRPIINEQENPLDDEAPEPLAEATAPRRRGRPRKQPLQDAPEPTEQPEQSEPEPELELELDPETPSELPE